MYDCKENRSCRKPSWDPFHFMQIVIESSATMGIPRLGYSGPLSPERQSTSSSSGPSGLWQSLAPQCHHFRKQLREAAPLFLCQRRHLLDGIQQPERGLLPVQRKESHQGSGIYFQLLSNVLHSGNTGISLAVIQGITGDSQFLGKLSQGFLLF